MQGNAELKKYKVLCPLINFQIPWGVLLRSPGMTDEEAKRIFEKRKEKAVKGINLVEGVKIRQISKEDLEDLKTYPFPYPTDIRGLISPRMFVLEKQIKVEKEQVFGLREIMQNIILSLRLLKGGLVFGSCTFHVRLAKKRQVTSWSYEEDRPRNAISYVLNFEEVPRLRKIVRKIQSVDFSKRKSLDLACRRFQRAYEEMDVEDRLIDLMIAFEALFLRVERRVSSKGKLIAVACSTLLGKNEKEREDIKQKLVEAYSIRNCIVHGSEYSRIVQHGKGDVYVDTLPDLVSEVENYLRESIIKLLD